MSKNLVATKEQREKWNVVQWSKYVNDGLKGAAESIIQAGVRMHEFKTQAKCCKGGSEFSKLAQERFGLSASMASRWASIGENSKKLLITSKDLPTSVEAVYMLSTLSEEQIKQGVDDGVISTDATQKEIKAFKREINGESTRARNDTEHHPQPDGNEDQQWDDLLNELESEPLAIAVWDGIINKKEAQSIKDGKANKTRMAKKLFGDKKEPNLVVSQVAEILSISDDEVCEAVGIQRQHFYGFEITHDILNLEKELRNPKDTEEFRSKEAMKLYHHFRKIVDLWTQIVEE